MKRDKKEISYYDLKELEKSWNKQTFLEVPIGSLMADFYRRLIIVDLKYGSSLSLLLKLFYSFIKPTRNKSNKIQIENESIIITKLDDRPHLNKLIDPVIFHFKDRAVILSNKPIQRFSSIQTYNLSNTEQKKFIYSLKVIKTHLLFFKKLMSLYNDYRVPFKVIIYGQILLLHQLRRVVFWDTNLKKTTCSLVLTEYDRYESVTPLILTAKKHGIKTVTLVHGAFNPNFGFTPIIADKLLCWGRYQQEQLLNVGENKKNIDIIGCSMFDNLVLLEKESQKTKLNINKSKVVTLAINPVGIEFCNTLIKTFANAVEKCKDTLGLVKLHPSQNKKMFEEIIENYPNILFLSSDDISNDQLFSITDILCFHNTGLAMEAILKGLFIIVLDVLPLDLGISKDFVQKIKCPIIKSSDDLALALKSFFQNETDNLEYNTLRNNYINHYFFATGKDAEKNTIEYLELAIR